MCSRLDARRPHLASYRMPTRRRIDTAGRTRTGRHRVARPQAQALQYHLASSVAPPSGSDLRVGVPRDK